MLTKAQGQEIRNGIEVAQMILIDKNVHRMKGR